MLKNQAKLKKISLSLPFGIGSAEWEADPTQRKAAWALYVELVTRVSTETLEADKGLLREALNSLYQLFPATQQILKEYGPDVGGANDSVGGIAIAVLNKGLRPFLSKWHASLQAWEQQRQPGEDPQKHEKNWIEEPKLRREMEVLRHKLKEYADALAIIVGID